METRYQVVYQQNGRECSSSWITGRAAAEAELDRNPAEHGNGVLVRD